MKKHKFTWIDALVILVAVVLVAGTFLKFFVKDTTSVTQDTVTFTYQLKIEGIRQCSIDTLQVGDTVYNNDGKGAVGVISAIEVQPNTTLFNAPDGTIQQVEKEGRFNVILTLSAEGVPTGRTYKVGTYTLQVNQSALYFTKYSIWNATTCAIG